MKHFPGPWFRVVATIFQNPLALVAGILLSFASIAAHGQNVTFAGAQTTLPFTGLLDPQGIAVDSAGDVIIADYSNRRVVELARTATGYGPQTTLPVCCGSYPLDVALDTAGDLFAVDDTVVLELSRTPTGYGPQITLHNAQNYPTGVAVDMAGNVFISSHYYPQAVELPRTPTGYGAEVILPFTFSGLSYGAGIAVDGAGDVFVADPQNGRVEELPRTGMGYDPQTTLPFSGVFNGYGCCSLDSEGSGIAVDSAGNVFFADTLNSRIVELPWTGAAYGPQITLPKAGLDLPLRIAVDSVENVFATNAVPVGGNDAVELQTVAVDFGGANVCAPGATTPAPCSQTLTLTYNINADTTLGEPQVATGALKYLDFNRASGSTCIGAVTAGTICTVNVTFSPLAAGFRNGSVIINDDSSNRITTTPLSGFGIAATTGAPVAQLSTGQMSFGTIDFGTIKTLPLFVANIGGGTLTVAPSVKGASYNISDSTCAAGVTPGNSCTLVVEYSPRSIGPHDDTLTVATNGGSPIVGLWGSVAGLSVLGGGNAETLVFGTTSPGSTETRTLTVTNVGLPGTVMVGTAISGLSFSVLTEGNTCLAGIEAGQSCSLPVQFAPTHSGLHDELLTLTPFPGAGSTTVWLSDTP